MTCRLIRTAFHITRALPVELLDAVRLRRVLHVVGDCWPVSCEISFCCTHTMRLVMSRPRLMSQTTTARRKLFFFSFHLRLSCRHLISDLRKTSLGTLLGVVRAAGLSSSWPLQLLSLLHASSMCKCFPLRQTLTFPLPVVHFASFI